MFRIDFTVSEDWEKDLNSDGIGISGIFTLTNR